MLRPIILAVLLTVTVSFAAPIPKEQPAAKVPNYFPCELGTKWEYECGKDFTVVEVTKVRHEKDCKIVTFTHARPSNGTKGERRYRVTKDAVYGIEEGRNGTEEGLALKLPPKDGDTWTMDARGLGTLVTVINGPEKTEVPAGKFDTLISSTTLRNTPINQFEIRDHYADGVGRVKTTGYRPDWSPSVLKKFTPPPK
jgi:hypothetical protein